MGKKTATESTPQDSNSKTIEELQKTINELKKRNMSLESEKAELFKQSKQIKEVEKIVEKIVEIPVERIVEIPKIIKVDMTDENVPYRFNVGDKVYIPERFQRMEFEVRAKQGFGSNQPLYRLFNHERGIEEEFVPENKIKRF